MSADHQNKSDAGDKSPERQQSTLETKAVNKERNEAAIEIAGGALNKDIAAETLEKRLTRKSNATGYGVASADSLLPEKKSKQKNDSAKTEPEKRLSAEEIGPVTEYTLEKQNNFLKSGLGVVDQLEPQNPVKQFSDFVGAAVARATDLEGWNSWINSEATKLGGIGAGLNEAKEETKNSVAAGWKALTDGTVAEFLSHPDAINAPLFRVVGNALDAMGKDPDAVNKAFEAMGGMVLKASEQYSNLPDSEKGKAIGNAMFYMINPEGSLEAPQAAMKAAEKTVAGAGKVLDVVATHVDKAVMDTVTQSMKAIEQAAKNSPEAARRAEQMLCDYLKNKGLTTPEMEYAGVPKQYINNVQESSLSAKGDDYLAMSKPKDGAELSSGADSSAELPKKGFRGDWDYNSTYNDKGRLKSHINDAGDLVPVNPEGIYKGREVTIVEHINANFSKAAKAQSPYTSFGAADGVIAKYGGEGFSVDFDSLRTAITKGEVPGVKIVEHSEVLKAISEADLPRGVKQKLFDFAVTDREMLVKGIVPKRFIQLGVKK